MAYPFRKFSAAWLAGGLISTAAAVGLMAGAAPLPPEPAVTSLSTAPTVINWNGAADVQDSPNLGSAVAHNHADSLSHSFRAASAQVIPSVVTIQSIAGTKMATSGRDRQNQLPDELQNHPFFKRYFEGRPEGGQQHSQPRRQRGTGSGVIIDRSGIILTNNHVVDGADKLIVKLHDGRELEATDWKTDPKTDIAIVVVETDEPLPAAHVGNSDSLQIGDWVIAVGAPFGLNESVTAGIISAKSRGIGITDREEFLQTDAAINPGNSGGPLVNLAGEVVGINTAISTTSGGYQGIGFAVPINLARWIGDQLMSNGSVHRAFLGVGIQAVTSNLSEQFGLDHVSGAVVTEVRPGTAAAEAGLQTGDVIVEFDGRAIRTPRDLQAAVERAALDDKHEIVVFRGDERKTLRVSVTAMPQELAVAGTNGSGPAAESKFDELGLEVTNLTSEIASQLGMENATGVVVTNVLPGSPAAEAGLTASMVISRIGQSEVTSVDDFRRAAADMPLEKGVLLLVRTANGSRFVVIEKS